MNNMEFSGSLELIASHIDSIEEIDLTYLDISGIVSKTSLQFKNALKDLAVDEIVLKGVVTNESRLAFEKLLSVYLPYIEVFARYFSKGNEALFDDLVQEGFLAFREASLTFDFNGSDGITSYVFSKIVEQMLSFILDNGDDVRISVEEMDDILGYDWVVLEDENIGNVVNLALATLSPRQRDVLKMRFGIDCDPCTYKVIAKHLERSDTTVVNVEKKALERLRSDESLDILRDYWPEGMNLNSYIKLWKKSLDVESVKNVFRRVLLASKLFFPHRCSNDLDSWICSEIEYYNFLMNNFSSLRNFIVCDTVDQFISQLSCLEYEKMSLMDLQMAISSAKKAYAKGGYTSLEDFIEGYRLEKIQNLYDFVHNILIDNGVEYRTLLSDLLRDSGMPRDLEAFNLNVLVELVVDGTFRDRNNRILTVFEFKEKVEDFKSRELDFRRARRVALNLLGANLKI